MFKDENKSSSLAKQLTGFDSVILDTCSLMEDSFPEWLDVYSEAKDYLDPDFTIAVPEAAIAELKKHSHDRKNVDKRIPAIRALKIFKEAKRQKLLCVGKKNHNQNFADNAIYSQVSEDRLTQKILVITQDKKLATDLKNLNNLNSQKGRRVSVFKVISGGKLAENRGEDYQNYQRTYERNDNRFSDKEGRFAQKPMQNRPQNNVSSPIQKDPATVEILLNDKKLNADLKNPNYPLEGKVSDIKKQLALLASLPEEKKKGLSLLQGEIKLKQSLQILDKGPVKKETVEKPASAQVDSKKEDLISNNNHEIFRPEPNDKKREEPTVLMKTPAKKLWYGEGRTLGYALDMVAEHYSLMFRDPSIAYVSFVHGPLDLTQNDREKILDLLQSGLDKQAKFESLYSSFKLIAEKGQKGFKVYLDLHPVASVQPETAAMAELPSKAKMETSAAPQPDSKGETSVELRANSEKKKPVERVKKAQKLPEKAETSSVMAVPNTSAAVPEGVTLVVGIPTDQRKRDWIERTARRDALGSKSDGKKVAKKSTSTRKETSGEKKLAKPTEKKAKATATAKAASKKGNAPSKKRASSEKESKETVKPGENAPAKKPIAKQKKQAKKADPKPQPASPKKGATASKASPSPLEAALASEKKLKSNFHNPNYPSVSKKKDIEEQIKAVRKLSLADRSKLSFGLDALRAMASLL